MLLNNLAVLYVDNGRYAEAEPLQLRSLVIWEKALGPEHPELAIGLNNMAKLYVGANALMAIMLGRTEIRWKVEIPQ